jgi:hypothetical protein
VLPDFDFFLVVLLQGTGGLEMVSLEDFGEGEQVGVFLVKARELVGVVIREAGRIDFRHAGKNLVAEMDVGPREMVARGDQHLLADFQRVAEDPVHAVVERADGHIALGQVQPSAQVMSPHGLADLELAFDFAAQGVGLRFVGEPVFPEQKPTKFRNECQRGELAAQLGLTGWPANAAQKGVAWLLAHQGLDGTWDEAPWTGTGFPRVFYLKYHYYRIYWPLMALARMARATQGKRP